MKPQTPAGRFAVKGTTRVFSTFVEAEKFARRRHRTYKSPQTILFDSGSGYVLATVCSDAFGRLWTDLTWKGSRYA
jgi:hypothetical protein